jgi:hypothetical protein
MIVLCACYKYLKLLRNYQGYFLVACLHISYVAKNYQQGISNVIAEDGFKPHT